jgi:UDP-N-acetylmuramate dehydrogenase
MNIDDFKKNISVTFQENARLSNFTTFQIGGPCPLLVHCESPDQVKAVIRYFIDHAIDRYVIIGGGSNILVSDRGIPDCVLRFCTKKPIIECHAAEVTVNAGTKLDDLSLFCAQKGLLGLNFVSGIPGTVGGAIAGNAGAFGQQISDTLKSITVLDKEGEEKVLSPAQCLFSYRYSRFKDSTEIVLSAKFHLQINSAKILQKERDEILSLRKEKHPNYQEVPCAGSFFKNLEPLESGEKRQAAGWFLDQIGAKQMSVGGAAVFKKHANIIIKETKQCTANDIYALSQKMRKAVIDKFGIALEPEVRLMGEF